MSSDALLAISRRRRPLHPMFVPFPVACFIGTLLTDLAYWKTANIQWNNFSAWLLAFGMLTAGLAILAGIADLITVRGYRLLPWRILGNLAAVALSLLNCFIHSRDAFGVIPLGPLLSLVVVVILLFTGWRGWDMAWPRASGIAE